MKTYQDFLMEKSQLGGNSGFKLVWMPDFLFDFQAYLVEWALLKGRAAIFADCGTGKTPMQLVWAENIVRKTNKRVLILTPLAVSHQTVTEAEKFGIECHRSHKGELYNGINVTNYERLHMFDHANYEAVVCDESSILKSFEGKRKLEITEFMKKVKYRLLATATAAPNDYPELGTSAEALGELGYMDMLMRFFKNDQNSIKPTRSRRYEKANQMFSDQGKWRFKGHAETPFWQWVSSWSRAMRRPSDYGFEDKKFILPPLIENEYIVKAQSLADGMLFPLPAVGLKEQGDERRRTIKERCEKVGSLVSDTGKPALVWCHMNPEGDLLEKIITDAVQVSGKDSDESKEEKFTAFVSGQIRVLVTKPKIGAWGLNFQHCDHVTSFPSHSFEQLYQGVRRCWRFGQVRPVTVDMVTTEGEMDVIKNLKRKAAAADKMFSSLVAHMNESMKIETNLKYENKEELPSWL
jgi:hypothetical protein